jgi:hypothetical protein
MGDCVPLRCFWRLIGAGLGAADLTHRAHGGIPVPGLTLRVLDLSGARALLPLPTDGVSYAGSNNGDLSAAGAAAVLLASPVALSAMFATRSVTDTFPPRPATGDAAGLCRAIAAHAATLRAVSLDADAPIETFFAPIALIARLSSLDLSFTDCGADGGRPFVAMMTALQRLRRLALAMVEVPGAALAAALAPHRRLRRLSIAANPGVFAGDASRCPLLAALRGMASLRRLDVEGTGIRAAPLAQLLATLAPTLQALAAGGNRWRARGVAGVTAALEACHAMRCLDLSHTDVGDAAAADLALHVAHWPAIRELQLASCGVGAVGAAALARAVAGTGIRVEGVDLPTSLAPVYS